MKNKGLTLVELMIIIAIIALFFAFALALAEELIYGKPISTTNIVVGKNYSIPKTRYESIVIMYSLVLKETSTYKNEKVIERTRTIQVDIVDFNRFNIGDVFISDRRK